MHVFETAHQSDITATAYEWNTTRKRDISLPGPADGKRGRHEQQNGLSIEQFCFAVSLVLFPVDGMLVPNIFASISWRQLVAGYLNSFSELNEVVWMFLVKKNSIELGNEIKFTPFNSLFFSWFNCKFILEQPLHPESHYKFDTRPCINVYVFGKFCLSSPTRD